MAEHLPKEIIDRYLLNTLSGKQRFNADMHIANCSNCRERLGEAEKLQSVFNAFRFDLANITEQTIEHPGGERLSDFINKKLGEIDSEIVASHLAWCSICLAEVEEMETYGRQLELESRPGLKDLKEKAHRDWVDIVWTGIQHPSFARPAKVFAVLMLMASASYVFLNLRSSDNPGNQTARSTQDSNSSSQSGSFVSPSPTIPSPASPSANSSHSISPKPVSDSSYGNLTEWTGALPADRQLLSNSLRNGIVEMMPGLSEINAKMEVMGGNKDHSFALLSPAGQVRRDSRITLKWEPLKDAAEYRVIFRDAEQEKALSNQVVKGTEYKLDIQLRPGHRYRWQVIARIEDSPEIYGQWANHPYADFMTLGEDELRLVQDAEKNYQPDKDPMAYLALAVRYAKAGLVEDAERMLKAYLKERPDSPQVVKMLSSLKRQSSSK